MFSPKNSLFLIGRCNVVKFPFFSSLCRNSQSYFVECFFSQRPINSPSSLTFQAPLQCSYLFLFAFCQGWFFLTHLGPICAIFCFPTSTLGRQFVGLSFQTSTMSFFFFFFSPHYFPIRWCFVPLLLPESPPRSTLPPSGRFFSKGHQADSRSFPLFPPNTIVMDTSFYGRFSPHFLT